MDNKENNSTKKSQETRPLSDLVSRMDGFFSEAFKDFNSLWNNKTIPIETEETKTAIIIRAMLPGYNREQIELEIMGRQLRIALQNSASNKEYNDHMKESYRKSERVLTMPFPISKKDTTATYKNGVLRVIIPKDTTDRNFISIS